VPLAEGAEKITFSIYVISIIYGTLISEKKERKIGTV
jgi:hypothetical protein